MFLNILLMIFLNMFVFVFNPMFMSLILIIMTVLLLMNVYSSFLNMWFSYMLCLIYLGGVLILFIYISSFLPSYKTSSFSFLFIMLFWFFVSLNFMNSLNFMFFNNIFEKSNFFFLMFMLFYLVFVLLITVYYSSFNKMPLRSIY